jgi:hypothetical protein
LDTAEAAANAVETRRVTMETAHPVSQLRQAINPDATAAVDASAASAEIATQATLFMFART